MSSYFVFKTETDDEDVVFVSEKPGNLRTVAFDQEKRQALQREIDQQSQPELPVKPLTKKTFASVAVQTIRMKVEMEEDENLIKKEKKRKKREETNCSVDNGNGVTVKKAKKRKNDVPVKKEEDKGGEMKEKKKKRRRETDSLGDVNGLDVMIREENNNVVNTDHLKEEAVEKKKVKCKPENTKEEKELHVEQDNKQKKVKKSKNSIPVGSTAETKMLIKEKKKKKVKCKPETRKEEEEPGIEPDNKQKKVKKSKVCISVESKEETEKPIKEKKKKKLKCKPETRKEEEEPGIEPDKRPKKVKKSNVCISVESKEETEKPIKEKKKKRKGNLSSLEEMTIMTKKARVAENGQKLETVDAEVQVVKLKNKKEHAFTVDAVNKKVKHGSELKTQEGDERNMKKKIKKDAAETTSKKRETDREKGGNVKEDKTLKKKKDKSTTMEVKVKSRAASEEASPVETQAKKKKKKKDKKEEELLSNACKGVESGENHLAEGVKKIKEEPQEVSQADVVFLSSKSGNTDEIDINKDRRRALQMQVDEASQPSKATGLGQWGTAQFDQSEQQQKFLRLMGAFKKGAQPAEGSPGGASMALGKGAQQQLQKGLLGEFERAHSRRMDFSQRAAGLGFSAPSNKKFSIDVDTRRSVRFDD